MFLLGQSILTPWAAPPAWIAQVLIGAAVLPLSQMGLRWARRQPKDAWVIAVGTTSAIARWIAACSLLATVSLPSWLQLLGAVGFAITGIFGLLIPMAEFSGHEKAKAGGCLFLLILAVTVLPAWTLMPGMALTSTTLLADHASFYGAPSIETVTLARLSARPGPHALAEAHCGPELTWTTTSSYGKSRSTTHHRYTILHTSGSAALAFIDGGCPTSLAEPWPVLVGVEASETLRRKASDAGWPTASDAPVIRLVPTDEEAAALAMLALEFELAMYAGAMLLGASLGLSVGNAR